jgi:hypothetical protein
VEKTAPYTRMSRTLTDIYVGVYVIRKLQDDLRFSTDEEKFELKYVWQCLRDWKTYAGSGFLSQYLISHRDNLILSGNNYGGVGSISYWCLTHSIYYTNRLKAVVPYSRSRCSRQQSSTR